MDKGRGRENLEDSVVIDKERGIYLLADGMGGHQAGEVASKIAVDEAYAYLRDRLGQAEDERATLKALTEALLRAHDAIMKESRREFGLMGMGTTLIEMVIKGGKAYICHVGDSRAYLIREGIMRLTRDHTVDNYLVEHDLVRFDETKPHRVHTLTQAVGVSNSIAPELKGVELEEGDLVLLCSDGLTDMLTDDDILGIVRGAKEEGDLEGAVASLVEEGDVRGSSGGVSGKGVEVPRGEWESGQKLLGEFVVEGKLGEGGMGVVYLVRSERTGERFAVKRAVVSDEESRHKFLLELQVWVDIGEQGHVVGCRFFRSIGEEVVIFAEYMDGGSLRGWIDSGELYKGEGLRRV
ncbi:MAG: protein phosphatase 2C domain-containing protein, partial [Candidatus Bathyarchaeia archaeon]